MAYKWTNTMNSKTPITCAKNFLCDCHSENSQPYPREMTDIWGRKDYHLLLMQEFLNYIILLKILYY